MEYEMAFEHPFGGLLTGTAEITVLDPAGITPPSTIIQTDDAWQVEVYHRGLKQHTGVERAQYRLEVAQRNHISLAIRAFIRLEVHRIHTNTSWFEAKASIIRSAIRAYLACPEFTLYSTA